MPSERSPLIASNAKTIPRSGPTIRTNSSALGIWTPVAPTCGDRVNRKRNSDDVPVACDADARIVSAAKYIGINAATPRTSNRITKRADQM